MNRDYAPRHHIQLPAGTIVEHPPELPELVHMKDPASFVLIDFHFIRPPTITPGASVEAAKSKMKTAGAHLLLVTDGDDAIVGQVTACEIMGDAPVRLAVSNGIRHDDLTVGMMMTPREQLKALEWSQLENARVGHIVNTMHQLECCSLLVVESGHVRGLFCATEMSRHLGNDIEDCMICAHSLAEMVHALA